MPSLWHPDRIGPLGDVMNRLAPHIEPGFRFRRGMEGDPMYPFDNPDQAPRGTVEQVFRGDNGTIRFQGRMDGSGALEEFTNVTADPNEVWEMDPTYADAFRRQREGGDSRAPDASYRGEVEDRFRAIDEKLDALRAEYADFRRTFADAMVEVSRDVKAVQKGEDAAFCGAVSSRADDDAHKTADVCLSEMDAGRSDEGGGSASPVAASEATAPPSRHDFDVSISRGASSPGIKSKGFKGSRHGEFPTEIPFNQEAPLGDVSFKGEAPLDDKSVHPLLFEPKPLTSA